MTQVDLRRPASVSELARYDLIWVRGGNTFVFRVFAGSGGADEALLERDLDRLERRRYAA